MEYTMECATECAIEYTTECAICCNEQANTRVNCGHSFACEKCMEKINKCSICRANVTDVYRITKNYGQYQEIGERIVRTQLLEEPSNVHLIDEQIRVDLSVPDFPFGIPVHEMTWAMPTATPGPSWEDYNSVPTSDDNAPPDVTYTESIPVNTRTARVYDLARNTRVLGNRLGSAEAVQSRMQDWGLFPGGIRGPNHFVRRNL